MERIETVIVGGGQAGLATSYFLTRHGREHVVLEQAAHPAHVWRDERWDSFTLVTPNWTLKMPGAEYDGADRESYMPRDEVVAYFDRYVERFQLPVRTNTRVDAVERLDRGFLVRTERRTVRADNVVVATGYEQSPKLPACAGELPPDITQLHSSRYRNPESLPAGAVLVVGSAQSGCQIAEELYQRGRRVFLSTGSSAGRAPRRYRGKDVVEWLYNIGFFDLTPDRLPVPVERFHAPHVSGVGGGRTLNLHQFARDGVTLLGHVRGAAGTTVWLAPDLHENLQRIDGFELQARQMIDGYVQARGLDAPADELVQLRDGYEQPAVEELDLRPAGITSVIWATGYACDYGLVKAPVQDRDGFVIQTRGVTPHAGLYFVGMPWMPSLKTGTLVGVGEAADHIVSTIITGGASRETAAVPRAASAQVAATPVA